MTKKKVIRTAKGNLRRSVSGSCFNALVVAVLFAALVLSGGCGGGGGSDSPKAETAPAEEVKTVAVVKEEGVSDAEAFKEAEGLIDESVLAEQQEQSAQSDGSSEVKQAEQSAQSGGSSEIKQAEQSAQSGGSSEAEQPEQAEQSPAKKQLKLRSIVLGATAADDVSDIEEVIVPANVRLIGMNAFDSRWSSLKRVIITDTSVKLSYRSFNNCPKLEGVYIGDGTSSNYFDFKSFISSHASDSYSYPEQAFYSCPRLKAVSFGNVAPPSNTAFISSCGSSVGGTVIEAPYAKYGEYNSRLGSRYTVSRKTWSESFPDTMLVNQISIPGTHDSCTYQLAKIAGVDVVEEAETQTMSLESQLAIGVRCFDLRPFHEDGYSNPVIHHGPISCQQTFHSAIDKLCNHLRSHPRDFLIVIVNHEGFDAVDISGIVEKEYCEDHSKASGDNQIQDELQSWKNAGYAADFKPGITVKDMRGKMLFISRDTVSGRNPVGAYTSGWGGWQFSASLQSQNGSANLIVQDLYNYNSGKLANVKTILDYFAERVYSNHSYTGWCVNQASAYYDQSCYADLPIIGEVWQKGINYPYNADKVNGPTASYISGVNGPTGMIIMDFAGKEDRNHYAKNYATKGQTLVDAVINHNF